MNEFKDTTNITQSSTSNIGEAIVYDETLSKTGDSVISPEVIPPSALAVASPKLALREQKIKEHYRGNESLTERINSEEIGLEELLKSLICEYAREVDNLAGNQVMATENGQLETSTVISSKRTEIIDRLAKVIMAKKEFDSSSSIDVESPSMKIVFKYFMTKCHESFTKAGFQSEVSDVFFRTLADVMQNWRKDLKKQIAEIKTK